jgi:preprotein translocase subunit SecE
MCRDHGFREDGAPSSRTEEIGVSTKQQDCGPINPAKRLSARPGASPPATPPAADGTTRPLPPKPAPRTPLTGNPVAAVVTRPAEEATDPISRLRRALEDIWAEVKKVTWPTRPEIINLTIVVIGLSAFVGVTLGTLDALLGELIRLLTTG